MKDLRLVKMRDLEKIQERFHFVWGIMADEYMSEEDAKKFREEGWIGFLFDFETEEKKVLIRGGLSRKEVFEAMEKGDAWVVDDLRKASSWELDDYIEFEKKSRRYGIPII